MKLDDDIMRNIGSLAADADGVRHRRRKSFAHWRLRAEALVVERKRMPASLPERSMPTIGNIHLPLLSALLAAAGHGDVHLLMLWLLDPQ